jgi:hypothetical protein
MINRVVFDAPDIAPFKCDELTPNLVFATRFYEFPRCARTPTPPNNRATASASTFTSVRVFSAVLGWELNPDFDTAQVQPHHTAYRRHRNLFARRFSATIAGALGS